MALMAPQTLEDDLYWGLLMLMQSELLVVKKLLGLKLQTSHHIASQGLQALMVIIHIQLLYLVLMGGVGTVITVAHLLTRHTTLMQVVLTTTHSRLTL